MDAGPPPDSKNTHQLETPRLLLDVPRLSDGRLLFALVGGSRRDEVCENLVWDGPEAVDDIWGWVERSRTEPFGDIGYHWVIRDRTGALAKTSGDPLGTFILRPFHFPGRTKVGYWLGTPYWRQGIMTEALSAVLDLAIGDLGVVKVEADVFSRNRGGRRLVEGLGFTQEAMVRRAVLKRGEWLDEAVYGLLAEEWQASDRGGR